MEQIDAKVKEVLAQAYDIALKLINDNKELHKKITLDLIKNEEISEEEYFTNFHFIADRHWHTMKENDSLKKRKKFCDFLLRKGFESNLVYEKVKDLERDSK